MCFGLVFHSGCLVIFPRADNTHAHTPASGLENSYVGGKIFIFITLHIYNKLRRWGTTVQWITLLYNKFLFAPKGNPPGHKILDFFLKKLSTGRKMAMNNGLWAIRRRYPFCSRSSLSENFFFSKISKRLTIENIMILKRDINLLLLLSKGWTPDVLLRQR